MNRTETDPLCRAYNMARDLFAACSSAGRYPSRARISRVVLASVPVDGERRREVVAFIADMARARGTVT